MIDRRHEETRVFRPGDLVECIREDWTTEGVPPTIHIPRVGEILRVTAFYPGVGIAGVAAMFLSFHGCGDAGYESTSFDPLTQDHSSAETEISAEIRRYGRTWTPPVPAGVPAL